MTVMEKDSYTGDVFVMSSNTLTECMWLDLNPRGPFYEGKKRCSF